MIKSGMLINGYYTLERIGVGGMGEVWKCKDTVLERNVALKFVNEAYSIDNPKSIEILKDEAKLGAKLIGHPNVVTVLDYGVYNDLDTSGEIHYIVMECIEGINLNKWIKEYTAKYDESTVYNLNLYIAWEICKAVNYSHSNGVLHRDIKPSNIFLSNIGFTKIGDFGIGRFVEETTRAHTMWQSKTPAYCSPEQWKGEKPSGQSDIYQLGCTLYQLFTGKLPFEVDNIASLINSHLNETPIYPNKINPIISNEVSDCIMKALEKDKDKRIDLWAFNDSIAKDVQSCKYKVVIDVSDTSEEIQDLVYKITEFERTQLSEGKFTYSYPDFSEVLSETIQLILAGIVNVSCIAEDIIYNKESAVTSSNG